MANGGWGTLPRRLGDFLVDHRVALTLLAFLGLGLSSLALGARPRDLARLHDPHVSTGLVLVLGGLSLRSWAAGTLRKGKGLTTVGPYRLCRHPLYLGSLAMMAGFCLLCRHVHAAGPVLLSVLGLYLLTMYREERRLAVRYGAAWEEYARRTPRMLPRRLPACREAEWAWAQWFRSREYNALGVSSLALAALQLWSQVFARLLAHQ